MLANLRSEDASFLTLRFLLGVAEAGFFPGMILYFTYWFAKAYRARVISALFIAVPGSNALDMDKAVRARMAELAKSFPKGVSWGINYDTNMFVSASMHDVTVTLAEGAVGFP